MRALVWLLLAGPLAAAADSNQWRTVADKLITAAPEQWIFNWGEGVQMIGLMKTHERTGEARYAAYVERWAAHHLARDVKELLNLAPAKRGRPGYCGHWSPATAILYLYQARRQPEHLRLAGQVAEFIRTGAERGPDGGLGHWSGNHQLWVDTLYMACPLLAGLGKLEARMDRVEDAARQILVQARYLQDARTGLFYHMWDWDQQTRSPGFWARGNGWVLMSLADTLEILDRRHPSFKPLKAIAGRQAKGIRATQDQDGLWRTVLDEPASYQETSAASMFCYGLLKLVRLGVLPKSNRAVAVRAWEAVNRMYVSNGEVTGVSAGTDPRGGEHYRDRQRGTQTWGTGAYLMAGSEIDRLRSR